MSPRGRRLVRAGALLAGVLLVAAVAAGLWLRGQLTASLAQLDGEATLPGLSAPVAIERDALGVPLIRGSDRADVARATGYVHAQERFFQMDLLRRRAAGELAALVGPAALELDREVRPHRFRAAARRAVEQLDPADRALLEAYCSGARAGLAALAAAPPEYLLLRTRPEEWSAEDSLLAVYAMYLDLQSDIFARESTLGVLYDLFPQEVADFLAPRGTEWDAPLEGPAYEVPHVPAALVLPLPSAVPPATSDARPPRGSNAFAVGDAHSADGAAWLANDLHLPLMLPNIWYRLSLAWPAGGGERRVTGITLPGAPAIVAGSNGDVAWGYTNSQADTSDLVVIETDPADAGSYRTPAGLRRFEHDRQRIAVHGGAEETVEVVLTEWGPVWDRDHRGRPRALRWVAHDAGAAGLGLLRMEGARSVAEALEIGSAIGIPAQNLLVADRAGQIGWTIAGPLPRRAGFDGRLPVSWADGTRRWDGLLAPADHPRIVDPPAGRLWSANHRHVGGEAGARIGDGGYDLGARARQIRDDLLALDRVDARDLLGVQLDDRALFLERWRTLLLATLTPQAVANRPRREELRRVVADGWTGRASIDSAAYRLVRGFRQILAERTLGAITARCKAADPRFEYLQTNQWEGPLWRLATERREELPSLAAVDALVAQLAPVPEARLAERTWGERNTLSLHHPLALAVPQLARWLDLPARPLPGDRDMPRVQSARFGASDRMVVAPGREEQGLFQMPGGQSGHPFSPFYAAGHASWEAGEPAPFLPGPPAHRLTLRP